MKVWIVERSIDYEGDTLLGIYSSEELARKELEKLRPVYGDGGTYGVFEWEVDS